VGKVVAFQLFYLLSARHISLGFDGIQEIFKVKEGRFSAGFKGDAGKLWQLATAVIPYARTRPSILSQNSLCFLAL
jgi:hypothetical protein